MTGAAATLAKGLGSEGNFCAAPFCYWHVEAALLPICYLRIIRLTQHITAFCVISATAPLWGQAPPVSTTPPTSSTVEAPAVSTTPPTSSTRDDTVTVRADGENTYVGEIVTADDNVVVHDKGDVIFADHIIWDRSTNIMIATGNARIFTSKRVYRADSITYNLDTKAITSINFTGADYPRFIAGQQVTTPGFNHYRLTDALFTTSNRQNPSFHFKAGTIEYRPNDEVVLKNVVVYVGDVPVFYVPILVQSLTDSRPTYQFQLGDSSQFGYFMENTYNWVANDKMRGSLEFDVREKRGFAGGVDVQYFPSQTSDILLKTYYAQDNLYSQSDPSVPNAPNHGDLADHNAYDGVPYDNRYRVAYQHYLQFGPDFSSTADLNFWSDPWVTRDYFQGEYQQENQPANFVSLNQYNPNFTISLLASPQVNPFFETVERLPEFEVESKQQKLFGTPIEYTSQSSVVNFERKFADTTYFQNPLDYPFTSFPNGVPQETAYNFYHPNQTPDYNASQLNNYSAYRYDTYQEFAYPHQYFNFLSLTPRIGGRFTYYSDDNQDITDTINNDGQSSDKITDPKARLAGDIGLAGDFKISRTWLDVSDPNLGINGIRHEIEPFFDAQYAPAPTVSPNAIRGFDDRLYSTQLQPLDWTEYNSIDSIDREAVVRFGFWNKIQTKREGVNYDLATLETYADADFDHNFSAATPNSTFSNLFNNLAFNPTPQLTFQTRSSLALDSGSYNEIDNSLTWSPDPSVKLTAGDNYINHSAIFGDSNQLALDLFYRINEHWQFEGNEQFEATTGHLQLQEYTIYRDLDAWQLGMTYSDSEYNNQDNRTVYFSLTLKAFPKYQLHTPRL
jgi:LPS-assembly protein